MKKIFILFLVFVVALLLVITLNTVRFNSKQLDIALIEGISVDNGKAAERLALAIKLPTISHQNTEDFIAEPFLQLIDLISDSFPQVKANLEKKVINQYSLLYKWRGKNLSLKPITFLAHLDVVPPDPEIENQWQHPPFSGKIADGFIWGRGTLDDKSSAFGILEAVEHLLNLGFVPNRTIYLAFGYDEETGGLEGAAKIAQYFKQQGIFSLLTLDEGMVILDEKLSPAKKLTGVIGIAEKGYTTLKLTATAEGGHSSIPSKTSAVGILAKAITALEEHQMPSRLSGSSGKMFDFIGSEMGLFKRMLFANRWLFEDIIISDLEKEKSTSAMIRTTTAITMIKGGIKENVLPSHASAIANFRILPGNNSKDILEHARRVVANPKVTIEFLKDGLLTEPSKISATNTHGFMTIGKTIKQIFKGVIFTPGLVLGGTDSKHYQEVADNNYRFSPFVFGKEDLDRVHGINERIGVKAYGLMIKFYAQLIMNLDGQIFINSTPG